LPELLGESASDWAVARVESSSTTINSSFVYATVRTLNFIIAPFDLLEDLKDERVSSSRIPDIRLDSILIKIKE
jgi:hypothetical protein